MLTSGFTLNVDKVSSVGRRLYDTEKVETFGFSVKNVF